MGFGALAFHLAIADQVRAREELQQAGVHLLVLLRLLVARLWWEALRVVFLRGRQR